MGKENKSDIIHRFMNDIIDWNEEQREHEQIFQQLCLEFNVFIINEAIKHDNSKWSAEEYETFLGARDSLRGSKDGTDKEYTNHYKSDAIQHHVKNNSHHPEFWDERGLPMPVVNVIAMFFDWLSRSKQRNMNMDDFWEYNISKLSNQPHAIQIVEALKRDYGV
jgi:hypothetical protein